GDNRKGSCDSRRFGLVPRRNLIGPVFATYWPLNRVSRGLWYGAVLLAILAALTYLVVFRQRGRETTRVESFAAGDEETRG
ncbi:MAG: S26 family signal peptidase, partial [Gaiellaceae bacterium]